MAMNMHGFSLFPSTVPKIAIPNPHKKTPSLHRISLIPASESRLSANGESIVIKMEEERPPVPRLPSSSSEPNNGTVSPENIGRAVTTMSPIDGRTPTQLPYGAAPSQAAGSRPPADAARYSPSLYQSSVLPHSSPEAAFSMGSASAATLVPTAPATAVEKLADNRMPVDPSPIVPIRSMFPTYDPSLPLQQQPYAPQRPLPARLSGLPGLGPVSRDNYRSSLSTPFAMAAQRPPASVLSFPSDAMSVNIGPRISTQRELEKLWEASHGAEPGFATKPFDLEMARTEEATFVFGSHPSMPFYTLQTYDSNEIAISKTGPRNPSSTQDVVLCPLEPASRRQSPNDGLVAFIFPKLAAMLAINQSASLAREHSLAPTDRDDIEAQAVRRAAKQEACRLYFNNQRGFYELEHPAIGRDAMGGDFAIKSPVSPPATIIRSRTGMPVLHITISTDSPLPTISVVDPNAAQRSSLATPMTSAGPGIRRLSTVPQPETASPSGHAALATLDLTSQILHLDANAILELMPSLFSIDCIVSALMAVAVADATTNPTMGSMEIWKPRPAPASRLGTGGSRLRAGSMKSYAGSVFYATIAEREEAEEEARLMREAHEKDMHRSSSKGQGSRTWFGFGRQATSKSEVTKKKSKTKQIVVTEFDLEKLGHYQSGDREGEELPAVTRSALSILVVGLKLLVWTLTMVAQVLAWVLVNLSRAVTSDKF